LVSAGRLLQKPQHRLDVCALKRRPRSTRQHTPFPAGIRAGERTPAGFCDVGYIVPMQDDGPGCINLRPLSTLIGPSKKHSENRWDQIWSLLVQCIERVPVPDELGLLIAASFGKLRVEF
jgi:hypothetical protein